MLGNAIPPAVVLPRVLAADHLPNIRSDDLIARGTLENRVKPNCASSPENLALDNGRGNRRSKLKTVESDWDRGFEFRAPRFPGAPRGSSRSELAVRLSAAVRCSKWRV